MKTSTLMGSVSRFAHFSGLAPRALKPRAAEDDDTDDGDKKSKRGASEDEDEQEDDTSSQGKKSKKSRASEDDNEDGDEDDKKSKSKASDDDDEGDDAEPNGKKSKKSRAADDDDEDAEDDDDKEEMSGKSAAASARRRERNRCSAIFASKHAVNNVALAASLAFETTMTRSEAIAVLKGQAGRTSEAPRRNSRESRNPDLGASIGGGEQKPAASWGNTFAKLGIKPV
jgi:hypothetical protein